MSAPLRIGLVGLDTSHVPAFTRLLNDAKDPHHVAGGKVVAAYPGGTDWAMSASRVDGYTEELRKKYDVAIYDNPEDVAKNVDALCITEVDGRVHRQLFERLAPFAKPTFVDKPFAMNAKDAQAIIQLAQAKKIMLMSCSSLRYAKPYAEALMDDAKGPIQSVDIFGPMTLEDALPGLFWYGCHSVEMVVAAMGVGCETISATTSQDADVFTLKWGDGRVAVMHGMRGGHGQFGATIHRKEGFQLVDAGAGGVPPYAGLLTAVIKSINQQRSEVPPEEMLEAVRIMEAGNMARTSGQPVALVSLAR